MRRRTCCWKRRSKYVRNEAEEWKEEGEEAIVNHLSLGPSIPRAHEVSVGSQWWAV